MKEINYIDAKQAQTIRKEVRRLLSRDYSRDVTVPALHALGVGADSDDEAAWPGQLVDRLRVITDTPDYVKELHALAVCAYAEYRVEFHRRKIERKGYKLSDAGAVNLFVNNAREYMALSSYPENISEAIAFFVDATHGRFLHHIPMRR